MVPTNYTIIVRTNYTKVVRTNYTVMVPKTHANAIKLFYTQNELLHVSTNH